MGATHRGLHLPPYHSWPCAFVNSCWTDRSSMKSCHPDVDRLCNTARHWQSSTSVDLPRSHWAPISSALRTINLSKCFKNCRPAKHWDSKSTGRKDMPSARQNFWYFVAFDTFLLCALLPFVGFSLFFCNIWCNNFIVGGVCSQRHLTGTMKYLIPTKPAGRNR